MKCSFLSIVILSLTATALAGMTFDDIEMWVGEGSNQAALVIDWNDGDVNSELVKVWGFRWDGTASGADMLLAVCQADSFLYTMAVDVAGKGLAFGGIGYDRNQDGVYDIMKDGNDSGFDAQGLMVVSNDTQFDGWVSTASDDNWSGGWWADGFWGYYIDQGAAGWSSSLQGASGRILTDGSWDGWSWGSADNGWYGGEPSVSVAVPEPVTWILFVAGVLGVRLRKKA